MPEENNLDINVVLNHKEEIQQEYIEQSANNFLLFAHGLFIPSENGSKLLAECIADFQLESFKSLEPALAAVKNGRKPENKRFWIERTKKASKDGDLAICMCWLIAFAIRPLLIQICACDKDQAAIVKRRMESIIHYNPWLRNYMKIHQYVCKSLNGLAEMVIEATDDTGGSHGETPDVLVLNELVHVKKWEVMETHMDNADGTPRGIVIVSTNAGIKGTKAEVWRKEAIENKERWITHIYSKVAPWIDKKDVTAARKRDPIGSRFARLWGGKWISGKGDAVNEEAIDSCFCLQGPIQSAELGWQYVAGLDLGVSHDHAGITVVGVNKKLDRMRIATIKGFEPCKPNDRGVNEVDLMAVEEECFRLFRAFNIQWFGYDPAAGGSFMAQRLRSRGTPMKEMSFAAPKNCTAMAVAFVLAVKEGKLECYEDDGGRLRRDFGKFSIEAKVPAGYKLVAVSDEYGHADVGTALIICLPRAVEMLGGWGRLDSGDDLINGDEKELEEKEVEELPDDLRDIYEIDDEDRRDYSTRPTISETSLDPFRDYM